MVQWDKITDPDQDSGPGTATKVRGGKVHNTPTLQGTTRTKRRTYKRLTERTSCQRATGPLMRRLGRRKSGRR